MTQKAFIKVPHHENWSIAIDVGGTFTDCIARSPAGEIRQAKVLSSGVIKGTIKDLALDGVFIEDPLRAGETENLYQDYEFTLLDKHGKKVETQIVEASSGEQALLTLTGPLKMSFSKLSSRKEKWHYELSSGEPAPLVAIRRLLGLTIHDQLSGLDVRLGTTRGTNALLERKGNPVALLTTKGFGDTPLIGNQTRPDLFALKINKPDRLHQSVIEIEERIDASGNVITTLNQQAVESQLKALKSEAPDISLAICLVNSYQNPAHEQTLKRIATSLGFKQISVASELSNTIGFLSRMDTALVDAYLSPVIKSYIQEVKNCLGGDSTLIVDEKNKDEIELIPEPLVFKTDDEEAEGAITISSTNGSIDQTSNAQTDKKPALPCNLKLMTSAGGLVDNPRFSGRDCILSGPAGGVTGMAAAARQAGYEQALGFDMGGTSTDVCRFGGEYEYQFETEKAGVRLSTPMYAIETVAAGGGSICHFDGQRLLVGPESAGSHPGPACYGRGGPLTVTDMNLICGRVDAQRFPFQLNIDAVHEKLDELRKLEPLKHMSRLALATGFLAIANQKMADAVHAISRAKGYEPAAHALVSFGGAAGQHACAIADELGVAAIIQHPYASILSSYGISLADEQAFSEKTLLMPLARNGISESQARELLQTVSQLKEQAAEDLQNSPAIAWQILLDLRYENESTPLTIQSDLESDVDQWLKTALLTSLEQFEQKHEQVYGHHYPDRTIECVNMRVLGRLTTSAPVSSTDEIHTENSNAPKASATLPLQLSSGTVQARHYEDGAILPGQTVASPAIIYQSGASLVLEPGWSATKQAGDSYLVKRMAARSESQETAQAKDVEVTEVEAEEADPLQLELFNQRFTHIATQMGHVLQRTSVSVNVKDRLDFSCAILDRHGDLIVNAPHIPVHLGAMGATIRSLLAANEAGSLKIEDGDVFITNDPALGGSHLPDVTVITPVFIEMESSKQLAFFTASRAHHAEIGGIKPGSMHPFAENLAQEGVIFQHEKIMTRGQFQSNLLKDKLLSADHPSRMPEENQADIQAAIAANRHGAHALIDMCQSLGANHVFKYMGYICESAAEKTKAAIQKLAERIGPGPHVFEDCLDGQNVGVKVSITLEDGKMHLDFTGSAPVQSTSLNANEAIVRSAILYVLRLLIDEDIPLNEGVLSPIKLLLPEGMLNPPQHLTAAPTERPAVVGGNVELSQKVVDVLLAALKIAAASQGTMNNLIFGNENFGYYETICGGTGGTYLGDGTDAVHSHMTNTRMTDVEILEANYPVRLRAFSIRKNAKLDRVDVHRGGSGIIREIEFLEPVELSLLTQRRDSAPFGLKNGKASSSLAGEPGSQKLIHLDGSETQLPGMVQCQCKAGDRLILATPSAGSYSTASHPKDYL